MRRPRLSLSLVVAALVGAGLAHAREAYRWPRATKDGGTVESRVAPPAGFRRIPVPPDTWAAWLRGLPAKPGRPDIRLYDGTPKRNQQAHHLVLDIDVGTRDRQQCADAVIRLRAEFLRQADRRDALCFRFTDGSEAPWPAWERGLRPRIVGGRKTTWQNSAAPDASEASFRRYLDVVFTYAGTLSLARDLQRVDDVRRVQAGDVFIQGGSPGHAVIVVDVAEDDRGRRAVLLAQSYMPAQDIHLLRNPRTPESPWYVIERDEPLVTPEWRFPAGSLRRFDERGCPPRP